MEVAKAEIQAQREAMDEAEETRGRNARKQPIIKGLGT